MKSDKPISAVAARKSRQVAQPPLDSKPRNHESKSQSTVAEPQDRVETRQSLPPKKKRKVERVSAPLKRLSSHEQVPKRSKSPKPEPSISPTDGPMNPHDEGEDDVTDSLSDGIDELGLEEKPITKFTDQKLTEIRDSSRIVAGSNESVDITLKDVEFVTILGQYDIWVRKGSVQVFGALLHSSAQVHRVFASACHALPSISHARSPFGPRQQDAVITILPSRTGLRKLRRLNPKFTKLWNSNDDKSGRSFRILHHTKNDKQKRPLVPFKPSDEWRSLVTKLTNSESTKIPTTLICGPKGTGKSTLGRFLSNSFLARKSGSNGIAFLDLDPAQPEFTPPGEVSLHHIRAFNLGPPFTHPAVSTDSPDCCLRSHYIGHITPREDVSHYKACAQDLYNTYQKTLKSKGCPLIVNCCGWIQSSGLELLETFIQQFDLLDVVYTSNLGPPEVVEVLSRSCSHKKSKLHLLASPELPSPSRTASELRLMQTMSYFHTDKDHGSNLFWDATPLYLVRPYVLKYSGDKQDIIGITVLGQERSAISLKELINGHTLALVAIEDRKALPPSAYQSIGKFTTEEPADSMTSNMDDSESEDGMDAAFYTDLISKEEAELGFSFLKMKEVGHSRVVWRDHNGLPYLYYGNGTNIPLDPSKSRVVGQVLVRGVGTKENIEILTPIPEEELESLRSKDTPLVLVKGAVDTPGWTYLEEYYEAKALRRDYVRWKKFCERHGPQGEDDSDSPEEFDVEAFAARSPWIVVKDKDKRTKSKGSKAWKARRNLTTSDGSRAA